ncbi:hypothetical protein DCC39_01985 [Pueribacillus theae]|uniref:GIY-YIG domain-containing protein n=1 Tax=Pueribacillus theae TaxID=2171751 RepID=A0A2U1K897_9BACI|nr:hypothetical protein [Pueribacillus theae]PWA13238.1 hypothetical protein DCC39_01985 [Pueribacillus theae]
MEKINALINKNLKYFDFPKLGFEELTIDHDMNKFQSQKAKIENNVPCELGMYIYTNASDNKVLYVGEGNLQKRLIRHLQKIRINHSQESSRYYFFFALQIKMRVLFIKASKIGFDKKRLQNLECAYKLLLNPIYDQMVMKNELYQGIKLDLDKWDN